MCTLQFILIILLICMLYKKNTMKGGSKCPDNYVQARCMGPKGEAVCVPHPHDPTKPTIYV